MCVCARVYPASPIVAVVIDDDVVNLVVDVDVEPRGAGNEFLTRSCLSRSRVVVGDVATAGDAAAAAAAAAGKARKNLEVQVDVAGVAAAAVVATTTPDCLEVNVQDGCDVEAETKMGTAKPGGSRSGSPRGARG